MVGTVQRRWILIGVAAGATYIRSFNRLRHHVDTTVQLVKA